jgi:delta24-sterol reductase
MNDIFQKELGHSDHQFVDAVCFGKDSFVLMLGNFATKLQIEEKRFPIFSIRHSWSPFFYQHFLPHNGKIEASEELMPTLEYLFRYDRGAFWCASIIHDIFVPMLQNLG